MTFLFRDVFHFLLASETKTDFGKMSSTEL